MARDNGTSLNGSGPDASGLTKMGGYWPLVFAVCTVLGGIAAAISVSDRAKEALGLGDPPSHNVNVKLEPSVHVEVKNNFTLMGPPAPANLTKPAADANAMVAPPASRSREGTRRTKMPPETEIFNNTHILPEDEK